MNMALQIIGGLAILVFGCASAVGAWAYAVSVMDAWESKRYARRYTVAAKEIGFRLLGESYWFSESPDAQKAIEAVGDFLMRYGVTDAEKMRREWREKIAKAPRAHGEKEGGGDHG